MLARLPQPSRALLAVRQQPRLVCAGFAVSARRPDDGGSRTQGKRLRDSQPPLQMPLGAGSGGRGYNRPMQQESWDATPLLPQLRSALEEFAFPNPTNIQLRAIPALLSGRNRFVLTAPTGSGKTLAYLLPLMQRLKSAETNATGDASQPEPFRPRAVILVPTRELAKQIRRVVRQVSFHCPIRTAVAVSGTPLATQRRDLGSGVDLLITTPGRLQLLRQRNLLYWTHVDTLVVDEADTLLDTSFRGDTLPILTGLCSSPQSPQIVAVSATYLPAMQRLIESAMPGVQSILAPGTHVGLRNVAYHGVYPRTGDKYPDLIELVRRQPASQLTLVFCNSVASCRATEHAVREAGLPALCFHAELPPKQRVQHAAELTAASSAGLVAVATDAASRGLDTRHVTHVVMLDLPRSPIDFLHRAGRTGRAGARGRVTCIIAPSERRRVRTMLDQLSISLA